MAITAFSKGDFENTKLAASKLQQSNIDFCLVFSAYLLAEIYAQAMDNEKAKTYHEIILSNSLSSSVLPQSE